MGGFYPTVLHLSPIVQENIFFPLQNETTVHKLKWNKEKYLTFSAINENTSINLVPVPFFLKAL